MDFFVTLFNILCVSLGLLLLLIELAFFLRAILSFFDPEEGSFFAGVLFLITEPAILPVRALLSRLHIGEGLPIDLSFFVTFMLLSVLQTFLPAISL